MEDFRTRIHTRFEPLLTEQVEYAHSDLAWMTRLYDPSETKMKASILLCTIDRYELTKQCIGQALANADYPFELLCTDNASTDRRIVDYIASLNPAFHHLSQTNLGFPVAMNRMMQQSTGEYIVLIDNDTEVPYGWLRNMVETYESIPNTGQVALHSLMELHDKKEINGVTVRPGDWLFGVRMFHRSLLDRIGAICEDYGVYGLDDSDWSHRIRILGLIQYYLDKVYAAHLGGDVGETTPYRIMKNDCLSQHTQIYVSNIAKYIETGEVFIPFVDRPELVG